MGALVVIVALLMAAILALVAVLLWYREHKPRANSDAHAPMMPEAFLFDRSGVTGHERHELGAVTVVGRNHMVIDQLGGVPAGDRNHIVIDRPTIGRIHAVIECKHHGFWLVDQNSKNGTYVNDNRVTGPVLLTHGDRVKFHDFDFEFDLAGMSLADATVMVHFSLLRDSNARRTSDVAEEMGLDKRGRFNDSQLRDPATNLQTTAYGRQHQTSSRGDGESKTDPDDTLAQSAIDSRPGNETANPTTTEYVPQNRTSSRGDVESKPEPTDRNAEARVFREPLTDSDGALTTWLAPSPVSTRYQELIRNFMARFGGDEVKTILVTALERGSGTTTVSVNFASLLAGYLDVKVILIDVNALCLPQLPKNTSVPMIGNTLAPPPAAIKKGNIYVLPNAIPCSDAELLAHSSPFDTLLQQLRRIYGYVIIDGPPAHDGPGCLSLCSRVDGVVLVVQPGITLRWRVGRLKKQIEEVGGTPLGVVLNRKKYYIPEWLYRRL